MREPVVHVWCDVCWDEEEGTRVEADHTEPITLGGTSRQLDMCERHHKIYVTPLAEVLAKCGRELGKGQMARVLAMPRPAGEVAEERGLWRCPLCPSLNDPLKRSSARVHIYGTHRGEPVPEGPQECPDCDFGHGGPKKTRQGVATHRTRSHGYDPVAEALEGLV